MPFNSNALLARWPTGTVFVGIFQEEPQRDLLGISESIRVVGLFPLGYLAEEKRD